MFEIIIILVVGTIVVSIIQGARRGKATLQERQQNPTPIEKVSTFAEESKDFAEELATKEDAVNGESIVRMAIKFC